MDKFSEAFNAAMSRDHGPMAKAFPAGVAAGHSAALNTYVYDGSTPVAVIVGEDHLSRAAAIVRAVNSHDQLVTMARTGRVEAKPLNLDEIAIALGATVRHANRSQPRADQPIAPSMEYAATDLVVTALVECGYQIVPPASDPAILAAARHECAKSNTHDHDGCSCTDLELIRRAGPGPVITTESDALLFPRGEPLSPGAIAARKREVDLLHEITAMIFDEMPEGGRASLVHATGLASLIMDKCAALDFAEVD